MRMDTPRTFRKICTASVAWVPLLLRLRLTVLIMGILLSVRVMFNRVGMNLRGMHIHRKSELPILRPRASINMVDMGAACLSSTTPNTKHLHMHTSGTASSPCLPPFLGA